MPELPEVETIRRTLEPYLKGLMLQRAEVLSPSLRQPLAGESFTRLLGQTVHNLTRRGKFLIFELQSDVLVCHLGMSGRLLLHPRPQPLPAHTHLVLDFANLTRLIYVDPRRFGLLAVIAHEELATFSGLSQLGPEPFATESVVASLEAAKARSRRFIRDVLLDQRTVAGVGNIYACEALFTAGIRPTRRISELSKHALRRLAEALALVLEKAIQAGGTTLRDKGFRNALGEWGYFAVDLAVYGRQGQPCRVCAAPVVRRLVLGRSAYYCRQCQR